MRPRGPRTPASAIARRAQFRHLPEPEICAGLIFPADFLTGSPSDCTSVMRTIPKIQRGETKRFFRHVNVSDEFPRRAAYQSDYSRR